MIIPITNAVGPFWSNVNDQENQHGFKSKKVQLAYMLETINISTGKIVVINLLRENPSSHQTRKTKKDF